MIPPHDLDAERAVLGAALCDEPEAAPRIVALLKRDDFFTEQHRLTFDAIRRLVERGEPVDLLTLREELRRADDLDLAGGNEGLALLVEQGHIPAYIERYAPIIRDHAVRREAIQIGLRLSEAAAAPDADGAAILQRVRADLDVLSATAARASGGPVLTRLSDVAPERLEWVWPWRLASGKVAVCVGAPGLGKSLLTDYVAARVSSGGDWPDGGQAPKGSVVLLSAEDGLADTVRPRVDVHDGDPSRVFALEMVKDPQGGEHPFSLDGDLPALEAAIQQTDARLVVIDPLSAYLGPRADSWKDSDVRSLLRPLTALAEKTGVAVLAVMHTNKDAHKPAIHRTLGSVAFSAGPRLVLFVAKDPDHDGRCLLMPGKNNLSAAAQTLAYRVLGVCRGCRSEIPDRGLTCTSCGEATVGSLQWESEPVEGVDPDEVLAAFGGRDERLDAEGFLRDFLSAGPAASAEVEKAAEANGISRSTLWRAKKRLGIAAVHTGRPGEKGGRWYWSLPATAPKSPEASQYPETRDPSSAQNGKLLDPARTSPKSVSDGSLRRFGETLREPDSAPKAYEV